jgi:hypothetical protein
MKNSLNNSATIQTWNHGGSMAESWKAIMDGETNTEVPSMCHVMVQCPAPGILINKLQSYKFHCVQEALENFKEEDQPLPTVVLYAPAFEYMKTI